MKTRLLSVLLPAILIAVVVFVAIGYHPANAQWPIGTACVNAGNTCWDGTACTVAGCRFGVAAVPTLQPGGFTGGVWPTPTWSKQPVYTCHTDRSPTGCYETHCVSPERASYTYQTPSQKLRCKIFKDEPLISF